MALATHWDEFDAKRNVLETKHLSAEEIDRLVTEIVQETGCRARRDARTMVAARLLQKKPPGGPGRA